ncbi:MAG: GNAT family N-acetyltransferase [Treponema sp.]|jgi:Leu/Phe-tRNA-protein transferase|nr:GNAT family N-acetyltransferase [Treponema sp.]
MWLHYTAAGFLIIRPEDDLHRIVNVLLETGYNKDFCVSLDFDPDFIARLMKAGFLVMSSRIFDIEVENDVDYFVLLPKLHLTRSILFFDNLHIKKSIQRHLNRFELRPDAEFDYILDRCITVHGEDWLTPPLVAAIRNIRQDKLHGVYPTSFALYQDGKPVAGEFGIISGRVYTSYSGYYDENNAGTVQLILTARYLQKHGFVFFDLGMPMDYKTALGATDVSPQEFVKYFRVSQE